MSSDKPASSIGILAHLCALYGWMSWQFWNHTAAAVIWTFAGIFAFAYLQERIKARSGN